MHLNENNINFWENNNKKQEKVIYGLSGLVNMGNTCYMNATLQCLSKIRCLNDFMIDNTLYENEFYQYLSENIKDYLVQKQIKENNLDDDEYIDIYVKDIKEREKISITHSLHILLQKMWTNNSYITPDAMRYAIVKAPQSIFNNYSQHDSQEILTLILDRIHEECKTTANIDFGKLSSKSMEMMKKINDYLKKIKKEILNDDEKQKIVEEYNKYKSDNFNDYIIYKSFVQWKLHIDKFGCSFLTDLFCGQYLSLITCSSCHTKSPTFSVFMEPISIPISDSGENTLDECLSEFIKEEYLTDNNQYYCEICKDKKDASKQILLYDLPPIIIIQLKRYKNNGFRTSRKNSKVTFPIKDMCFSKYMSKYKIDNSLYNLCAVTQQIGSLNGGHYVAQGLNHLNNKWYLYDDATVTSISEEDIITNNSYILYYEKSSN